jgi:hypothetical protein
VRPGTVRTTGASAREMGTPSRSKTISTLFIGLSQPGGRTRSLGTARRYCLECDAVIG